MNHIRPGKGMQVVPDENVTCAASYPPKGLENAPQHVLCDIEMEGAHIETHGACRALLEVVGHGCRSVFLRLKTDKRTQVIIADSKKLLFNKKKPPHLVIHPQQSRK